MKIIARLTVTTFKKSDAGPRSAIKISVGQTQHHNFCPESDEDWLTFTAQAGKTYDIKTWPDNGAASSYIDVLAGDGKTVLGEAKPSAPDATTLLQWKAPEGKIYFIRLQPYDDHLAGTDTYYKFSLASEGLGSLPWYYYVLSLFLASLGVGGYKVVKSVQAKRAAPAAGYAAETRGIPLSFSDNPAPLPRKNRPHKNLNEVWNSLVNWANRTAQTAG